MCSVVGCGARWLDESKLYKLCDGAVIPEVSALCEKYRNNIESLPFQSFPHAMQTLHTSLCHQRQLLPPITHHILTVVWGRSHDALDPFQTSGLEWQGWLMAAVCNTGATLSLIDKVDLHLLQLEVCLQPPTDAKSSVNFSKDLHPCSLTPPWMIPVIMPSTDAPNGLTVEREQRAPICCAAPAAASLMDQPRIKPQLET